MERLKLTKVEYKRYSTCQPLLSQQTSIFGAFLWPSPYHQPLTTAKPRRVLRNRIVCHLPPQPVIHAKEPPQAAQLLLPPLPKPLHHHVHYSCCSRHSQPSPKINPSCSRGSPTTSTLIATDRHSSLNHTRGTTRGRTETQWRTMRACGISLEQLSGFSHLPRA